MTTFQPRVSSRFTGSSRLIAEVEARPVGFIQLIDPARAESHYWGEVPEHLRAIDLWIGEEGDLGKGYEIQMMHLALARCFAVPEVAAIMIDRELPVRQLDTRV